MAVVIRSDAALKKKVSFVRLGLMTLGGSSQKCSYFVSMCKKPRESSELRSVETLSTFH